MQHTKGAKLSTLVVNSNLDMGAFLLKTNHLQESTTSHGVQLDHDLKGKYKITASDTTVLAIGGNLGDTGFTSGFGYTNNQPQVFYVDPAIYGYGGSIRVKATLVMASGTLTAYVYKNGGTEVTWNSAGAKTQDVTVAAGDVITMGILQGVMGAGGHYLSSMSICGTVAAGP